MLSMTGFGKAEKSTKAGRFTVEVSSVNNRFLEVSIRMPRQFSSMEQNLRDLVKQFVSRGKVHIFVAHEEPDGSPAKYPINVEAATAYHEQLKKLGRRLGIDQEVSLQDLLLLPEVTSSPPKTLSDEEVWAGMEKTASSAIQSLVRMRKTEGKAMAADLTSRVTLLAKLNQQVKRESASAVQEYRETLTKRVEELLGKPAPDQVRLEEEVAIMAERTDISEECTRLASHVSQFKRNIRRAGPVGKRLNFILQEMNREANTIASKCTQLEISRIAISVKEEIEKLREQIQNIE